MEVATNDRNSSLFDIRQSHSFIVTNGTRHRVIVIVNSIFLQRSQKRGCGNQLIQWRVSKTKSIGSVSDPESQAGRQLDGYGGWCLELRRKEEDK